MKGIKIYQSLNLWYTECWHSGSELKVVYYQENGGEGEIGGYRHFLAGGETVEYDTATFKSFCLCGSSQSWLNTGITWKVKKKKKSLSLDTLRPWESWQQFLKLLGWCSQSWEPLVWWKKRRPKNLCLHAQLSPGNVVWNWMVASRAAVQYRSQQPYVITEHSKYE